MGGRRVENRWIGGVVAVGVAAVVVVTLTISARAPIRSGPSGPSIRAQTSPPLGTEQFAAYIVHKDCGGFQLPQHGGFIRVVRGSWKSGSGPSPEITVILQGGGYSVTRCTREGQLAISQTDVPIPVPGGGRAVLPVSTRRPGKGPHPPGAQILVTSSAIYADPRDPHWRYLWTHEKARILGQVLPPTHAAQR